MAKTKTEKSKSVTVTRSHRRANIAVIVVVCIAALLLITVGVLSGVHVDPLDGFDRPVRYEFYDRGSTARAPSDNAAQSKIDSAVNSMDFSVMSAVLQWKWDYSYNFRRYENDKKIEESASTVKSLAPSSSQYMIEYVYNDAKFDENGNLIKSTAKSVEVDGETVYFDRVKVLIGDTSGEVGLITIYPYLYRRLDNQSDLDGLDPALYFVTGIRVRANTTEAYAALGDLAESLKV